MAFGPEVRKVESEETIRFNTASGNHALRTADMNITKCVLEGFNTASGNHALRTVKES